ncbi:hypothetical protein LKO27_09355 [Tessaracoccus sp. OS52]|uniref:AMIN-like domain-containing (lipo)protein n=1 Tax=Tessaracoccus sp. OS52 TaxID=2886691 RepID=UPI001D12B2C7|nr:hypothetical protein [Tessaracoccus sp. OS52]MCC2593612.1 hypothetical protein [Tessaracoccus sp. OS52]
MRRAAAATAAVALLLAGCAEGPTSPPDEPTSSTPIHAATTSPSPTSATPDTPGEPSEASTSATGSPTTSPPVSPATSPSEQVTSSPTRQESDDPGSVHPWLTQRSEQEPRQTIPGDWQEITGVRTGLHEGYDRVVLELSGDEPLLGWFANLTTEAVADPSGLPLDVEGDAFLDLGIWAIDWTTEHAERYSGETVEDDALETVTQVVFGGLFEAQQQVVIGLEERTAYRIFTLADPARMVIDIRHD